MKTGKEVLSGVSREFFDSHFAKYIVGTFEETKEGEC